MSYPTGQLVSAPLTNGFPQAEFGTHISYLGTGGYRELPTLADRNAIPTKATLEYDGLGSGQRRVLMLVGVLATQQIYVLAIPGYAALTDADKLAALKDNSHWIKLADFIGAGGAIKTRTTGFTPPAIRSAVLDITFENGQNYGPQPAGSLPDMRFSGINYFYWFTFDPADTDGTKYTWVRLMKA